MNKNHLVLYRSDNYEDLTKQYIIGLRQKSGENRIIELVGGDFLTDAILDFLSNTTNDEMYMKAGESASTNNLLSIVNSQIAEVIGNQTFQPKVTATHLVILFDLDEVQMEYLKIMQTRANVVYHVFMKEDNYNSRNLVYSLQDYIPFMQFEVHR